MLFRKRLSFITILALAFIRTATAAPTAAEEAEAATLYRRANDYVSRIGEDGYSYAYLQFYWKRAQASVDRAIRVYPETTTGQKLRSGELKLGAFDLTYFKERVLPRLEEKKLAAFDAVNCAIFLYNIDEKRWDESRLAAMDAIIEVMSRQQRWSEALDFPVRDSEKARRLANVVRVAARFDQPKVLDELMRNAPEEDLPALWPILGEAKALLGKPREEIATFLDEHSEPPVKLAILTGMAEREIQIRRAADLRQPLKDGLQTLHYSLLNLTVRDDVNAVAATFFPQATPASLAILARYRAALGEKPAGNASVETHLAYLDHLAAFEKFEELADYVERTRLAGATRTAAQMKIIELYARANRPADAEAAATQVAKAEPALGDRAALARFRGQMEAGDNRLTVREKTFAALDIKDPCVLAVAIMDWSLTPVRSLRGAAPYDAVVQKFLPGFEDLPMPRSKEVQDAASQSKQY